MVGRIESVEPTDLSLAESQQLVNGADLCAVFAFSKRDDRTLLRDHEVTTAGILGRNCDSALSTSQTARGSVHRPSLRA